MMPEDEGTPIQEDTPIGDRLGSERLYDEYQPPPIGQVLSFAVPQPSPDKPRPTGKRGRRKQQPMQPPTPVETSPVQAKQADVNWRGIISSTLEIAGIAAITAGCALIAPFVALIVGGILVTVLGVATGWNVTN